MGARGWQIDEARRVAAIAALDLAELRDSAALTRITDFAAQLCETPIALVTLVEADTQTFLAATGTDLAGTTREESFCQHTIRDESAMIVPDASRDPRFADNPLVTGAANVRFYAGVPLVSANGVALGALCVLDVVPRSGLTTFQREGLEVLAADVAARFDAASSEARRVAENAQREARDSEARFHTLADTMPQMVWSTLPDGFHDYYNARWYEFTGVPAGSTDGEGWNDMFHHEDQERAWALWRHSLATGDPYQIEYRLRHHDGTYRWVLGRALPIRDADGAITRWFGTCTDIHEQRAASEQREIISHELSHRIKNIFAVISGLIGVTGRSRPEFAPAADDLRRRITALGRAHDFVRPHSAASAPAARQDSLHGLLEQLFAPYGAERITVTGDDLTVDDRAATPLALLFHELATNATKYGSLSAGDGRVTLTITAGAPVTIVWREEGGPPPTEPGLGEGGFGTQLLELSAVRQLGGELARDWRREGLVVTLRLPEAALSRAR